MNYYDLLQNNKLSQFLNRYWVVLFLILYIPVSYFLYGHAKLFDDNYIYLQYAKHFVENKELSFNLGEKSYAFTSPVWMILCIILYPLISYELIPVLLSLLFSLLTILLCWYLLKDALKNNLILPLAIIFIAFEPNFLRHTYNGFETSLTYLLSYLIILGIIHTGKIRNGYYIGAIFGLFMLVRPESIIFSFLTLLYLLVSRKINIKGIIRAAVSGIIIVLPWVIFTFLYFGKILPDTFGAKGGDYHSGLNLTHNLLNSAFIIGGNYFPIFILMALNFKKIPDYLSGNKLKYSFMILVIAVYVFFYSIVLSNELIYARYLCIIFPVFITLSILFIDFSIPTVRKSAICFSIVILIFLGTAFTISRLDKKLADSGHTTENEIIGWVNKNTNKDNYISRIRIGEIGFKTQRRIFDPVGLINRDIAGYYQSGKIIDYYFIKKPDYLIDPPIYIVEALKKRCNINVVKEFKIKIRLLVRQAILNYTDRNNTLKIYKIDWNLQTK